MRISALVMAKDEERNLARCLESLRFVDELVVLDTGSTDGTVAIARRFTKRVVRVPWRGYGPTRNEGFRRCSGNWLLSIDADEEVTPELADAIRAACARSDGPDAYRLPRRALFLGRWLTGGGWYPDRQLRLVRRGRGEFDDRPVHEAIRVAGPVGTLRGELRHHTYPEVAGYLARMNRYTTLQAEAMAASGRTPSIAALLIRPPVTFLRMFILKGGFRDGWHGFAVAALSAGSTFFRFAKHWDRLRTPDRAP